MKSASVIALIGLFLFAAQAHAGTVVAPVSFSVSSPDPLNATPATNNILDQSGLSANYVSGVTDFDSFVATTTASFFDQGELGGAGPPQSYFEFDFGSVMNIDAIAIWNQYGTASLDTFTVETSTVSDFSASQIFGLFQMSIYGGANPIHADVFTFSSNPFRYLRVNNVTNAGWPDATRLNEFAFRGGGAAVPLPGSGLLLAAGLIGVIGLSLGRRKRTV